MNTTIYAPTRIIRGQLRDIAYQDLPGHHALVITDRDQEPDFQMFLYYLAAAHCTAMVYPGLPVIPTDDDVNGAVKVGRRGHCDLVIAFGSRNCIYAAKAAAMCLCNNVQSIFDLCPAGGVYGMQARRALPIVTIPTCITPTAINQISIIKNKGNEMRIMGDDLMFPTTALISNELVKDEDLFYHSFDNLVRAIECYITNEHENRIVDMYSIGALQTIHHAMQDAYFARTEAQHQKAVTDLIYGGIIQTGLANASSHATVLRITAQVMTCFYPNISEGEALVLITPSFMKRMKVLRPQLVKELEDYLDHVSCEDIIYRYGDRCGASTLTMQEKGVSRASLTQITRMAAKNYARKLDKYTIDENMIQTILEDAWKAGELKLAGKKRDAEGICSSAAV